MPVVPIQETAAGIDLQSRVPVSTTVVASPSAATETIIGQIALTGDVSVQRSAIVRGWAAFTVGTSGTAVRLRIRKDNVSGTVIGDTGALTATAATLVQDNVAATDTSPSNTGQVYCLTLTVTSGAAASTVSALELDAIVV
jgi:hypothetical protein